MVPKWVYLAVNEHKRDSVDGSASREGELERMTQNSDLALASPRYGDTIANNYLPNKTLDNPYLDNKYVD